ncbi:hypothetical protein SARC_08082 [Sphaeroforma arctica JP610]|uniref:Uncharacterized protein n=1 Tax=Sphaeroforma arctica JP610 TaxID=667725 RepID=A0A0L0FRS9_9EUKA|nr:hypothetical protein SARC_08082 [Sphaeroforma arctica JP610]KNC79527.1 hypothetical protein SARC_08082 [Sphaeroforma arctica JP610]|eukprot:XP_014153429.1 hypothetical protein SARC_08082 [Sphaeroforma arctica JP610]
MVTKNTNTYAEAYTGIESHTEPAQVYQQMQYISQRSKTKSYLYELNAVSDITKYFDLPVIKEHVTGTVKTHLATKVQETIMPEEYYARCFITSHLSMMSSVVGLLLGHYVLCTMSLGVWLTSINYWWRPTVGLARTLDMLIVQGALWTHLYYSQYMTEYAGVYYLTMAAAIFCYFKASQHGNVGDFDNDTKFHCFMHFLGNLSNCILYLGLCVTA